MLIQAYDQSTTIVIPCVIGTATALYLVVNSQGETKEYSEYSLQIGVIVRIGQAAQWSSELSRLKVPISLTG